MGRRTEGGVAELRSLHVLGDPKLGKSPLYKTCLRSCSSPDVSYRSAIFSRYISAHSKQVFEAACHCINLGLTFSKYPP
jgi:hypothetical protein